MVKIYGLYKSLVAYILCVVIKKTCDASNFFCRTIWILLFIGKSAFPRNWFLCDHYLKEKADQGNFGYPKAFKQLTHEKSSQSEWPNIISVSKISQSMSGMLRCCRIPCKK